MKHNQRNDTTEQQQQQQQQQQQRPRRQQQLFQNPNRPEADQLAIYKCSREFEPGTTRINFNKWNGTGLQHRFSGYVK